MRDRKATDSGTLELLASVMGQSFVDQHLPLLCGMFSLQRQGLRGGSRSAGLSSADQIKRSLRKIVTSARRGDPQALRETVHAAPGVVRGWYLPYYLSRQIGPADLQGIDPELLTGATPSQIEHAARDALADPLLAPDANKSGRMRDLATERLIEGVRDAYEIATGKRATAWSKETGQSEFIRVLAAVALQASWVVSRDQLATRAKKHLRANARKGRLVLTIHRPGR